MKKKRSVCLMSVFCMLCLLLSLMGCSPVKPAHSGESETMSKLAPQTRAAPSEGFSFALTWGCYGISSYDSLTGRLVKTTDATHPEDYITELRLSPEQLTKICSLLSHLELEAYPDEYDPQEGEMMSKPSMTLILTMRAGDTEKTVAAKNIAISYTAENEKGQAFLSACQEIIGILTATEEWKALPEYEVFYD